MANELLNHSIKVTRTKGPPTPYVWEIYRGAEPKWMRRSMHGYATREKAAEAGYRALLRILDQKSSTVAVIADLAEIAVSTDG
jgi:hypothetical protein